MSVVEFLDDYGRLKLVERIGEMLIGRADVADTDYFVGELAKGENFELIYRLWVPALERARHFDLLTKWRKAALELGYDPYDAGRLVQLKWQIGDTFAAREIAESFLATVEDTEFQIHADDFHKSMAKSIVEGFLDVMAYERGELDIDDPQLSAPHSQIISGLYECMWNSHSSLDRDRIFKLAQLYIRVVNNPVMEAWVVNAVLLPNGFFTEAANVLDNPSELDLTHGEIWALLLPYVRIAAELDTYADRDQVNEIVDGLIPIADLDRILNSNEMTAAFGECVHIRTHDILRREDTSHALIFLEDIIKRVEQRHDAPNWASAFWPLIALRALSLEMAGAHEGALVDYLSSAQAHDWSLSDETYHVLDVLAANGQWIACRAVMRRAIRNFWSGSTGFGARSIQERLTEDEPFLPERGIVLSGWGIGDDLLRLGILVEEFGVENAYDYILDERLVSLAKRVLPNMTFRSTSRVAHDKPGSRVAFWMDREGVPSSYGVLRFTKEIHNAVIAHAPNVCMSEDLLYTYFETCGAFEVKTTRPIMAPSSSSVKTTKEWLSSLPHDKSVALAWRSGVLSREREKYFFAIEELEPLLRLNNINWIVAQYAFADSEIESMKAKGIQLHIMPGLDIRDDFEGLGGLFSAVECVVSPKLSTRDFAGALGVKTLSLSVGYRDIEQWRIAADGETDRVFPSITHLTEASFGDKVGVMQAAASRLPSLLADQKS